MTEMRLRITDAHAKVIHKWLIDAPPGHGRIFVKRLIIDRTTMLAEIERLQRELDTATVTSGRLLKGKANGIS